MKYKKEYGDEFVSVEHMLRAFTADKRFGQQLFEDLQIGENELKEAISAVRGSQRVTDQSMYNGYHSIFLLSFAQFFFHHDCFSLPFNSEVDSSDSKASLLIFAKFSGSAVVSVKWGMGINLFLQ